MTWWLWAIAGFGLLFLELLTPGGFFLLFFGVGAIIISLLVALAPGVDPWLQWLIFGIISPVMVILFRQRLADAMGSTPSKGDRDSIIGNIAIAKGEIAPGGYGKVEYRGTEWNAKNSGATPITNGARCKITELADLQVTVVGE